MRTGDEVRVITDPSEVYIIEAIVVHDVYGCKTAEVKCNDTGWSLWIPLYRLELVP